MHLCGKNCFNGRDTQLRHDDESKMNFLVSFSAEKKIVQKCESHTNFAGRLKLKVSFRIQHGLIYRYINVVFFFSRSNRILLDFEYKKLRSSGLELGRNEMAKKCARNYIEI